MVTLIPLGTLNGGGGTAATVTVAPPSRYAQAMADEVTFTPTITEAAASNVTSTLTSPRTYASVVSSAINPLFRYNIADVVVNSGAVVPYGPKIGASARTVDFNQPFTVEFDFDGQAFEIDTQYAQTVTFRVWGNEQTTTDLTNANGNNRHYYKVDFGSRAQRRVVIEYDKAGYFFGIITAGVDTISRSTIRAPRKFAIVGDSFAAGWGAGASNTAVARSYATYLSRHLGYSEHHRYGVPSTGFISTGGVNNYLGRISDLLSYAPDDILIQGSYNDTGNAAGTITTAVFDYLTALVAGLPDARIVVTSVIDVTSTNAASNTTTTAAIKAGVDQYNTAFGSTRIGWYDFHGAALTTGTGNTGATTGTGNADYYNSSTTTRHPTLAGGRFIGRNLARETAALWSRSL